LYNTRATIALYQKSTGDARGRADDFSRWKCGEANFKENLQKGLLFTKLFAKMFWRDCTRYALKQKVAAFSCLKSRGISVEYVRF